ncbi:cellulose synthase subunit BcsC-related outer membrane protein [Sphingomonas naphthae]|uniref:Cellulose synthase subunit BcsC-related outer membrane protein n=1 Tax=Sphingomonas naphthae TaxID=1813468 RepID=A0ABY7TJC2_9SPHN|nr:cellulose synthase subunit BcsC-related outer membrane protein [Sphingomonas naphthae]WCT73312.1 cellulose synthase subunit BcsC-related outer membrane protein [Sphingomonas naphthae]
MPVDYQPPMDVQTAPPGYYQPAPALPYAGNADAQRYMADQGAQAGAGYGMVPPVTPQPISQATYQDSGSNPFAAAQPAVAQGLPGATYQPAQYAPQQSYQPAYQPAQYAPQQSYQPAYQPAPVYQQAPQYQPQYQAPVYQQAPAYQPAPSYAQPQQQAYPTYRAPSEPALTYPTEAYSRQGFGTQTYGNADYAIAPSQGYAAAPRPTYQPAPVYSLPAYTQSYAAPSYAVPVYSQPAPQPVYSAPARTVAKAAPRRTWKKTAKVAKAKPRTNWAARTQQPVTQTYTATAPVQQYVQQPYAAPAQAYQPVSPQLNYGTPNYAPAPTYAPAPSYAPSAPLSYAEPTVGYGGDPEMDRINAEIASLSVDNGPRVEGGMGVRYRDGDVGLGRLTEASGRIAASTGLGPGRVELSASPVYVDAGRPTGTALARFGTNPLPAAEAVAGNFTPVYPGAPSQHDSGVAVRLAYDTGSLQLDGGTTPIGFGKTEIQGGARFAPRLGRDMTARIFAERRPVTDSVTSYAGSVDPATGARWGEVMKNGGGVGISYDKGAGGGFYADVNYYYYDGRNVRENYSVEGNVGGYLTAWRRDTTSITIGANVNYQTYDNNQNFFSYGHGGYFSPQQYLAVSFPLRYRTISGPLSLDATLTPGFQTYRQDGENVFPTSDPLQAQLLRFRQGNNAVLARYDGTSKSGFGVAFQGVGWYRVSPQTAVGGELRLNTFGGYNEAQAMLRLRQSLGATR